MTTARYTIPLNSINQSVSPANGKHFQFLQFDQKTVTQTGGSIIIYINVPFFKIITCNLECSKYQSTKRDIQVFVRQKI